MNELAKKYFELGLQLSKEQMPSYKEFVNVWTQGKSEQALAMAKEQGQPVLLIRTDKPIAKLKNVTLTFYKPDWSGQTQLTFDDVINIQLNDNWIRLETYGPIGDMYGDSVISFRADGIMLCVVS